MADAEQQNIAGTTSTLSQTSVKQLSFGTFDYFKMEADLVRSWRYRKYKRNQSNWTIGIGFKQCEMIIDFEKSLIYLHRISRKERSSYQHASLKDESQYTVFPIDISDNRIMTNSEVSGKKLRLLY